jgi:hypothetical protein
LGTLTTVRPDAGKANLRAEAHRFGDLSGTTEVMPCYKAKEHFFSGLQPQPVSLKLIGQLNGLVQLTTLRG